MNRKMKICLIGATAVGKSSLVSRYVSSIFSETYRTTIGVNIQTRVVRYENEDVDLVLWDLSGEDEFQNVQPSYLRGASGYLLVLDGTRRETLDVAEMLSERVRTVLGDAPFVVVVNKTDLVAAWAIVSADLEAMKRKGWSVVEASAKTGVGVEEAFQQLTDAIHRRRPWLR